MPHSSHADIARALAEQEFLQACNTARAALAAKDTTADDAAAIRVALARALARLGDTGEARRVLEAALKPSPGDRAAHADVILELADIVRLEADAAATRADRQAKAIEAVGFYRQVLAIDPQRMDALLRAASASMALGSQAAMAEARQLAGVVLELTDAAASGQYGRAGPEAIFRFARHRGDALAILGRVDEAARVYESLAQLQAGTAELADARFEAALIAAAAGLPRDTFKAAFPPLQLIVFAGHLPDRPGDAPRLPAAAVPAMRDAIAKVLDACRARAGLASAAAGADLLFIDALCARQGSAVHLVLPWSRQEFKRTSVTPFEPPGSPVWEPMFDRAMARAATVREIGQVFEPGGDAGWQYANEVTAGIALHLARASRLDVQPLVLWDGQPGHGEGGAADFHELWRQLQPEPIVVSPPAAPAAERRARPKRTERSTLHQEVKSVLFADIVGYSRLSERAVPEFVTAFLGRVSALVASSRHAPCYVNTWGDALFAVFDFAADAGLFALELVRLVEDNRDEWLSRGLCWEEGAAPGAAARQPLSIRVGLHAGPVVMHHEPITRNIAFTGAHVTRAARLEPIARPGEVYASEEFAALAEVDAAMRRAGRQRGGAAAPAFACRFAGTMPLAKDYPGRHHIYRVLPETALEVEELARAIHEEYCAAERARGAAVAENRALVPWEELSEDQRDANRAQAADIPHKLRALGWEVTAGAGTPASSLAMSGDQIEALSQREHDRWMAERERQGWTYAPVRDNVRRHHPSLVPWRELSSADQQRDRDVVTGLARLIERAGLRLRRL